MRRVFLGLALVGLAVAAFALGPWRETAGAPTALRLPGNVDLRLVQLSFQNAQRIASVLVEEGERVTEGQAIARLDSSRLTVAVLGARARLAMQQQVVARLVAGTRPEEVEQARALVAASEAELERAERTCERLLKLRETRASIEQEADNAKASVALARAQLAVRREALKLAVAGPRVEDVAEARAALDAAAADLALHERNLADAELRSPVTGVVRARLLHPGEMASPERPVVSLAVSSPKWVRVYARESDLPRVRPGLAARVAADGVPGGLEGWVGFVSPVAEFTPRTVETEELRTSLVYEVRVFVRDPRDLLRLGAPATVTLEAP